MGESNYSGWNFTVSIYEGRPNLHMQAFGQPDEKTWVCFFPRYLHMQAFGQPDEKTWVCFFPRYPSNAISLLYEKNQK